MFNLNFRMGCITTHCNKSLVSESDVVVVAVKPNVVSKVLQELKASLAEEASKKVLVSIAAGIGLRQLQGWARGRGRLPHTMILRVFYI